MHRTLRFACCILALLAVAAHADQPPWLPVRDQNPFVLGAGLPLPPAIPPPGDWHADASIAEANSQLIGSNAHVGVLYAAETRESRLTFAYAFDDAWSARVSLGEFWIGGGFLNGPIRHYHALIGAPQGDRGRLGVALPTVHVVRDGHTQLFLLDRAQQGTAPLLVDVTRRWTPSGRTQFGVSVSGALPLGDASGLQDLGATSLAISAFGDWRLGDALQAGARIGYLHTSGNDVLPALARRGTPFADAYARVPLWAGWHATLQYDLHGALYRDAPGFLDDAGLLSIGLGHALGTRADLALTLGEDVPIRHTQDVVLGVALRIHSP